MQKESIQFSEAKSRRIHHLVKELKKLTKPNNLQVAPEGYKVYKKIFFVPDNFKI